MSFFYTYFGGFMKIYLDYIFFINFLFDFILLFGVSIVLKRNVSKVRLFLGSLFGGISFFIVFISFSSIVFFVTKMFLAVIMILITFSYKNFKYTINNFIYLIILSIIMGGGLYLINSEIGYSNVGMIFFTNGHSVNIFILVLIAFLMVTFYSKYIKIMKKNVNNKYNVTIYYNNKEYKFEGYMDTGNNLLYFNRPVIIINKNTIFDEGINYVYIPFKTVSGDGVMKGVKLEKIFISGIGFVENIYLAIANDKFHVGDCGMILNVNLWEGENEE